MKKKVSVIVPIYNSSETLEKTLNSIINQNYTNLEIILINDGSTDNSIDICKEYAKRDNRIIIIDQKNSGVGESRNIGIEVSTGDFISFVDSDDTIDQNFYNKLITSQQVDNADIVISAIRCIDNNNCFLPYRDNISKTMYNKENFLKLMFNFKIGTAVWGKIYRRECILDLKFENIDINEDIIFFWNAVKKSSTFAINFKTYYNYYINTPLSLTKKSFSKENMTMIRHIDEVLKYVNCVYPTLINDALNYYNACLLHNLILYYDYICSDIVNDLYLEEINDMLSKANSIREIKNYFLIPEKQVNIDVLLNKIKEKIKRC